MWPWVQLWGGDRGGCWCPAVRVVRLPVACAQCSLVPQHSREDMTASGSFPDPPGGSRGLTGELVVHGSPSVVCGHGGPGAVRVGRRRGRGSPKPAQAVSAPVTASTFAPTACLRPLRAGPRAVPALGTPASPTQRQWALRAPQDPALGFRAGLGAAPGRDPAKGTLCPPCLSRFPILRPQVTSGHLLPSAGGPPGPLTGFQQTLPVR